MKVNRTENKLISRYGKKKNIENGINENEQKGNISFDSFRGAEELRQYGEQLKKSKCKVSVKI